MSWLPQTRSRSPPARSNPKFWKFNFNLRFLSSILIHHLLLTDSSLFSLYSLLSASCRALCYCALGRNSCYCHYLGVTLFSLNTNHYSPSSQTASLHCFSPSVLRFYMTAHSVRFLSSIFRPNFHHHENLHQPESHHGSRCHSHRTKGSLSESWDNHALLPM